MSGKDNSWGTVPFGTLADFRNGVNYTKWNFGRGLKVINVRHFQTHSKPPYEELDEINPEGVVGDADLLQDEDILFVRSNGNRELIGRSLFIKGATEPITHSAFTIRARIRSPEASPLFYAYTLRSDLVRRALSSHGSGTNINNLNQSILGALQVPKPPLPTQRKIAGVLAAYDELIENNTRRIKLLEQMAQALYREWFVRPCQSGRPPKEREFLTLGDVLSDLESGLRPKGGIDSSERGVPSIGAENISGLGQYDYAKEKFVSRTFFEGMNRGHVKNRDVLLYKDGAHIGKKSIFGDGFPHEECCINEHVFILRTNDRCTQAYLFFWLDQPDMTQAIRNLNANAAQPGLNQPGIRGLPIIVPPRPMLDEFDKHAESILSQVFNLAKKNNLLRRTRDLLLPKLISGEVDVSALEIAL